MKQVVVFLLTLMPLLAMAQVERDDQGRPVVSQHDVFDARGRLAVRITYRYDSTGVVEGRMLQSFDRQGRPRQLDDYSADEYLLFREVTSYDCHGRKRKVVQVSYDDNDVPVRVVMRYRYRKDGTAQILLNGHELVQ